MKKRDRVKRTKAPPLDVSIIIPQSERERERHPVETCRSSLPRVSIFYVIDKKKKSKVLFFATTISCVKKKNIGEETRNRNVFATFGGHRFFINEG